MKNLIAAVLFLMIVFSAIAQCSLDSGLVAYYPFNGNANDESGNGYNGSVSGATLTTDRFNQADNAYKFAFDGFSSDKIQVSGSSDLNFSTGGFSLSAWVKFSGTAGSGNNYPIVSKHICGEQSGYILMLYNGKLTFWLAGSGGYNVLSTSEDYSDSSWHHVVAVYDDINQYIYVDGVLKNSAPFVYTVYNSALWALGGYNGCNGGFNGKVDEVKIYDRPLSAAEILGDYNLTRNSLVAYLQLNGNTIDASGSGRDGTLYGNASLAPDRFNSPDRAYTFPDQTSNISLNNSVNMNLGAGFTINAWIKYRGDRQRLIVDKHVCGTPNGFAFLVDWDGQIAIYLANSGWSIVRTNDTLIEDRWYMVTTAYDAGAGIAKVYVDGEPGGSGSVTYNNFSPYPISIGETYQNTCVAGNMESAIDEVKIYDRALSDAEVETEYLKSRNGLAAFFQFNGNTIDESGSMNDGINHNALFAKDRYGIDNSSLFFPVGVESYVEGMNPGNNLPVGNSPRTFSAWINTGVYNQYGNNIFHYGTQQAAPTNMHFLITGVLGLGNGYGFGVVYGNFNLIDSTWHFVTGVYEGGTERITNLYVDGKLDVSGTISTEPNTILGTNWRMGRFMEGSANFQGYLDEVRVYNAALTQQEVWDLYQSTTTAPGLLFPGNDSILVNPQALILDWDSTVTANEYRILIANDSLFTSTFVDTMINASSFDFNNWPTVNKDNLYWKVRTINNGGVGPWSEVNYFSIILTDVQNETRLPKEFALMQNYPNPFNPSTRISYQLPTQSHVTLKVFDLLGREVTTLVNRIEEPGYKSVNFVANGLPSGLYYYRLQAGNYVETERLLFLR